MTDEERKAIEFLKALKNLKIVLSCSFWNNGEFEFNTLQKKQVDIILNLINKQEKAIDRMAEVLNNKDIDYLSLCDNCKNSNEECHGDYCKERIKEYFMNMEDKK